MDPLFKKASADFDEGGAKGLLLNHLAIDSTGRIVFDSSDDAGDVRPEANSDRRKSDAVTANKRMQNTGDGDDVAEATSTQPQSMNIDISSLRSRFFPDLARLDDQDVCPSLKNFDLGDPAGNFDIPSLKAPGDKRQEDKTSLKGNLGDQTGIFLDGDNIAGFEDDDEILDGFDLHADADFGEGGDAWVKTAAIDPQLHIQDAGFEEENVGQGQDRGGIGVGDVDPQNSHYAVSLRQPNNDRGHEDILSYFDNALQKDWAGPEHWRIRRIKETNKSTTPTSSKRKEKEPFEIDFASPLDPGLAEMIYTPAISNSAISLPKSQWKSKTRNLLPDDKHFNSRQLLRLFLKPKARMGLRKQRLGGRRQLSAPEEVPESDIDEAFWARKENAAAQESPAEELPRGDYDANFFQDDGIGFAGGTPDDEDDFADAREAFSPGADDPAAPGPQGMEGVIAGAGEPQEGGFGTQLVTQSRRLRPEYVQYARVAKKVDVRRLKEEMWKGIGFSKVNHLPQILGTHT